ncbi:TIGR00730 family Rossman fold protein [Kovacikia minuta CCNUW1]|uniref:LOG family protein n=1 Tax=Kovacikia minuta TaxID=2931930 RepID=UPI001CCDA8F4|nr:TIGR00730 family Rossman fold protein [Kovacikia minuta]UBF26921.1 TIGR00730 family Rossman fold protein [Kovacikia minuta CCNUW1]
MKSICVFCGSNFGARSTYKLAAQEVGRVLVDRGLGLVYGGGNVGLMGAIADAVLEAGGKAIGVIPQSLVDKELAHAGLTQLHIVNSMHERKALMAELSDGFIAMPGGFGTFEEFCEVLTWSQLGFHQKPCGLLNVDGYYDPLITLFDHAVEEQFVRPPHRSLVLVDSQIHPLLDKLATFEPSTLPKWVDRD